ncbi:hypothetical protein CPLU01_13673 [Colletotrichum plurivorum]|uniref:DUF7907 domain-containing protein n=1 Tax=Colletotrichum plurivorum TaxID=2175906 RepID=A0A8H6JQD6_9PEZI|nr:hypothetical protein CPLU01_13673 [Colletotrichum plurivorum]
MKFSTVACLLGAAVMASAQDTQQSRPFFLKYVLCDQDSDEVYLASCHSGAGQAGFCPERDAGASDHSLYYLNETSQTFGDSTLGSLTWNLPLGNADPVSSSLALEAQLVSNSATPIFSPGPGGPYSFGFDGDDELFLFWRQDDSNAVPEKVQYTEAAYYNWYVCWTFVGNYYYKSLVWVTAGPPVNPTCEKASVYREWA